jgi:hypothetical protein
MKQLAKNGRRYPIAPYGTRTTAPAGAYRMEKIVDTSGN